MKKTTLFLMFSLLAICSSVNAQTDFYPTLGGTSSTQLRAPQGALRYQRNVWLVSSAEMAAAGFVTGDVITSIGFNYTDAPLDIDVTGTINVYFQNAASTVVTNTKSATWSTAINGMTSVKNGSVTFPAALGLFNIPFTSNFIYNGGALFIAYDYQNASGALSTVYSTVPASTSLTSGTKSYYSATVVGTALTNSNFRPVAVLGKNVACARPTNISIPSTTLTSATIDFSSVSPVNLEYGPYDFTPGTGGTTLSGVSSPYTISGLPNSTAYEVYAKSDCGGFVGLSALAYGGSFHTTFIPANPDYNTSFEVDDLPNVGWVADAEPNGSDWFINYGGPGSALVQNGNYSAVSLSNTVGAASGIMYSRGVNLQGGNQATISFYARNYLVTSTNNASYALTVGSDQTAASQTTTIATEPALSSIAYVLKTYTFTPPADGVYYFGLTNTSPAVASTAETQALIVDNFTVSQTLANNEVLDSKFSTYPNPAKNVINVANTTDALISNIEITDLNGRLVKNIKLSDVAEAQVSVSDLAQGVYTMKIVSDKGTAVKKVIKE